MRSPRRAIQLQLEFGAVTPPIRVLTAEAFVAQLVKRRVRYVERVRFKNNRNRIITLGRDGSTLHIHSCFQESPDSVLDAVATFLKVGRRSQAYREAVDAMRDYWIQKGQAGGWAAEADDAQVIASTRKLPCCGTPQQLAFLRELYNRLNAIHFDGGLPAYIQLRISDRMESRFGHMRYHTLHGGERVALEIALNHNLFLEANERNLVDTMLHEMTHVEAWLNHGHRAHGTIWRRIARRVGCEPRACSGRLIRRRKKGALPITRIPDPGWLPTLPGETGVRRAG